jgi:hypothetical protein
MFSGKKTGNNGQEIQMGDIYESSFPPFWHKGPKKDETAIQPEPRL